MPDAAGPQCLAPGRRPARFPACVSSSRSLCSPPLAAARLGPAVRRTSSTSIRAAVCCRPATSSVAGTSETVSATCAADPTGTARTRCPIAGRSVCTRAAITVATDRSASAAMPTRTTARFSRGGAEPPARAPLPLLVGRLGLRLRFLPRRRRGIGHLEVNDQLHFVAHRHATGFQRLVPGEAEVLPAQLAGRGRGVQVRALRPLHRTVQSLDVEGDGLGGAVHGEVAGDLVLLLARLLDLGRLEAHVRALLHFEEVGRLEVRVALLDTSIEAG